MESNKPAPAPTPSTQQEEHEPAPPTKYLGYDRNSKFEQKFIWGTHSHLYGDFSAKIYKSLGIQFIDLYNLPDSFTYMIRNRKVLNTPHMDPDSLNKYLNVDEQVTYRGDWFRRMWYDTYKAYRDSGITSVYTPSFKFDATWVNSCISYYYDLGGGDTVQNMPFKEVVYGDRVDYNSRISPSRLYLAVGGHWFRQQDSLHAYRISSGSQYLSNNVLYVNPATLNIAGGPPNSQEPNYNMLDLNVAILPDSGQRRGEPYITRWPNLPNTTPFARVKVYRRIGLGGGKGTNLYNLWHEFPITKQNYRRPYPYGADAPLDKFDTLTAYEWLNIIDTTKDKRKPIIPLLMRDMRFRMNLLDTVKFGKDTTLTVGGRSITIHDTDDVYTYHSGLWSEVGNDTALTRALKNLLRGQDSIKYKDMYEGQVRETDIFYEVYSENIVPVAFMRGLAVRGM